MLFAALAFVAGVWMRSPGLSRSPVATAAEALYAIRLPDLEGRDQSISQWRGQPLVVNFWATWCGPCREEIPELVKMQQKYSDNGLQFVGISIDQIDKTNEFAEKFKMNYPVLIGTFDTIEISRQAGNAKGVLPYTVILDRKGRIVATELGGLNAEKLERLLKPLL
jgi:thiol-disulfide isomerase/thioredoxin